MATFPATARTQIRRLAQRAVYSREEIHAILDEGLVAHLGFAVDAQPYVMPTNYARRGDEVLIHGSPASRMLRTLEAGAEVCLTVTLVDGLVLARSAYHHSVNYRSVVVFGKARVVTGSAEKLEALRCLTNHVAPGRWEEVRQPTVQELEATQVLALPISEASAKVRRGPPVDDEPDRKLPVWGGVVPLRTVPGTPVPAENLARDAPSIDLSRFTRGR